MDAYLDSNNLNLQNQCQNKNRRLEMVSMLLVKPIEKSYINQKGDFNKYLYAYDKVLNAWFKLQCLSYGTFKQAKIIENCYGNPLPPRQKHNGLKCKKFGQRFYVLQFIFRNCIELHQTIQRPCLTEIQNYRQVSIPTNEMLVQL